MNQNFTRCEFLKLIGISSLAALTANSTLAIPPWMEPVNDNYGLMILVDGLRSDLFFELLEAGKLPNIKEHLVDRGVTMECTAHCHQLPVPHTCPSLPALFPELMTLREFAGLIEPRKYAEITAQV